MPRRRRKKRSTFSDQPSAWGDPPSLGVRPRRRKPWEALLLEKQSERRRRTWSLINGRAFGSFRLVPAGSGWVRLVPPKKNKRIFGRAASLAVTIPSNHEWTRVRNRSELGEKASHRSGSGSAIGSAARLCAQIQVYSGRFVVLNAWLRLSEADRT